VLDKAALCSRIERGVGGPEGVLDKASPSGCRKSLASARARGLTAAGEGGAVGGDLGHRGRARKMTHGLASVLGGGRTRAPGSSPGLASVLGGGRTRAPGSSRRVNGLCPRRRRVRMSICPRCGARSTSERIEGGGQGRRVSWSALAGKMGPGRAAARAFMRARLNSPSTDARTPSHIPRATTMPRTATTPSLSPAQPQGTRPPRGPLPPPRPGRPSVSNDVSLRSRRNVVRFAIRDRETRASAPPAAGPLARLCSRVKPYRARPHQPPDPLLDCAPG
jgi:hypothetical protein